MRPQDVVKNGSCLCKAEQTVVLDVRCVRDGQMLWMMREILMNPGGAGS